MAVSCRKAVYVYALIDPRDGRPFYFGRGRGDRAWQHARSSRLQKDGNSGKTKRIAEIKAAGLSVGVKILAEGVTEIEAMRLQLREIARAREAGDITNLTRGDRHQWEVALRKIEERLGCLLQGAKELKRPLTSDERDHLSWLLNIRSEIKQTMREGASAQL